MTSDNYEKTRRLVLGYLAKRRQEARKNNTTKDVTREDLLKDLRLDGAELDYLISYLAERFLVYVQNPMPHMHWTHAHITSTGMAHYEDTPI